MLTGEHVWHGQDDPAHADFYDCCDFEQSCADGATGGGFEKPSTFNPNVSLMYNPSNSQMYYFTWAQSTTPAGLYITNGAEPLKHTTQGFSPEKSYLYELGAKYNLLDQKLGIGASVFRLEKNNAIQVDAASGETTSSSDAQRNQGVELNVSGMPLPGWTIMATYARYDAKTTASDKPANRGRQVQYVPRNQATLWTTYMLFPNTPANLLIGGGVTWREGVYLNAANTAAVPANVNFDATISHQFNKHWRVQMNGFNLSNRLNYSALFANRAAPAVGRVFLFSLAMDY